MSLKYKNTRTKSKLLLPYVVGICIIGRGDR